MKQADVKVGGVYIADVSGCLRLVTVIAVIEGRDGFRGKERTRFRVKVTKTGNVLPKTRTAAALRPYAGNPNVAAPNA